jgi:four helix bundle protein
MATVRTYQELEIWKRARALSKAIWAETQDGTFAKDYNLKDQINDASGSIMDNIAEGFNRGGNKEFRQFLGIACGSCGEVGSQLHRACDRMHIDTKRFNELNTEAEQIANMIGSFIGYLSRSDLKGAKFIVEEAYVEYGSHQIDS